MLPLSLQKQQTLLVLFSHCPGWNLLGFCLFSGCILGTTLLFPFSSVMLLLCLLDALSLRPHQCTVKKAPSASSSPWKISFWMSLSPSYTQPSETELRWCPGNLCLCLAFGRCFLSAHRYSQLLTSLKPHFRSSSFLRFFLIRLPSLSAAVLSSMAFAFHIEFTYLVHRLGTARKGNCLLVRTRAPFSLELILHFLCFLSHERVSP